MAILIGTTKVVGNTVVLLPPAGFGSVGAIRLSNYTAFPVTVNNIGGRGQSAELLMPNQQNVYPTQNVSTTPSLVPTSTDTVTDVATNVYVEWSTEPEHDFLGVYPAQLSLPANVVAQAIFTAGVPSVGLFSLITGSIQVNSGASSASFDVHLYASVMILTGGSGPYSMELAWQYNGVTIETVNVTGVNDPTSTRPFGTNSPVVAPNLIVTNKGPNPLFIVIVGSNRTIPATRMINDKTAPRALSNTVVLPAGTPTVLSSADGLPGFGTEFNGQVTVALFSATVGTLYCQYIDTVGTLHNLPVGLVATANNTVQLNIAHPLGRVQWAFASNAGGAIGSAVLTVAPNNLS